MSKDEERERPDVSAQGPAPPPVDLGLPEGVALAAPKRVIAHGKIRGESWLLQTFRTKPAGEWWEVMRPVGPEMEIYLGSGGKRGGGPINMWIPEAHHVTVTGWFFGTSPEVVAWVGLVSDEVEHIEIRSAGAQQRPLELRRGAEGSHRFFIVFPPRGMGAEIIAFGPASQIIERAKLPKPTVEPAQVRRTVLNPIGWAEDTPPPGWPQERRRFPPGEGPRWREDFYLHAAPFPIYVVPPDAWDGAAGYCDAGRAWDSSLGSRITSVTFSYLGRGETQGRELEVENGNPNEVATYISSSEGPDIKPKLGWWFDGTLREGETLLLESGFLAGVALIVEEPPRHLGSGEILVAGEVRPVERWALTGETPVVLVRFPLHDVWISMRGVGMSDTELLELAGRIEPLEYGSDLFRRLKKARSQQE